MRSIGASARHEDQLRQGVNEACADVRRLEEQLRQARLARDRAVLRALKAGIASKDVAAAGGLSEGLVSRIRHAPRSD